MDELTPGPRRTEHEYEKTDRFLLIGGAVLVLLGLGLAADSWLSPRGEAPETPAFAQSADSARARFLRRDTTAAADSAEPSIPALGPTDSATAVAPDSTTVAAVGNAPTAVPASAPAPSPAAPAAAVTNASPPPTRTTSALAPATATPTAPPREAASMAVADSTDADWIVQAGAFGARENAVRLSATLDSLGYRTRVIQTGTLHRVQALGFPSRTEAKVAQARIAEITNARAVLIPPGS